MENLVDYKKSMYCCLLLVCSHSMILGDVFFLDKMKDSKGTLNATILRSLKNAFNASVFIETGTYLGDTANMASSIFETVYTIELDQGLYDRALKRFEKIKNIHVLHGRSPEKLKDVLTEKNKEKIIFWLDAHYSGPGTAYDNSNTPILKELASIRESGITDAIILIDDIRIFDDLSKEMSDRTLVGYPEINLLIDTIRTINPSYTVEVLGDILIAFLPTEEFKASPVIHACTVSRTYDGNNYLLEEVMEAEKIIALSEGVEKDALLHLQKTFENISEVCGIGKDYRLWVGLIRAQERHFDEACEHLQRAIELGCTSPHIAYYLERCMQKISIFTKKG